MIDSFVLILESKVDKIFEALDSLGLKIETEVKKQSKKLTETWLDNQDVMELLKISPRTLQNMRDTMTLPYSKVGGKIYYKSSDVENPLNQNYHG